VVWTKLVWLRIRTGKRGNERSGFHKMLGNYRVATQLVASRVMVNSIGYLVMWEHRIFDCEVLRCDNVYCCNCTVITKFV
jgi:hypothetical protein